MVLTHRINGDHVPPVEPILVVQFIEPWNWAARGSAVGVQPAMRVLDLAGDCHAQPTNNNEAVIRGGNDSAGINNQPKMWITYDL